MQDLQWVNIVQIQGFFPIFRINVYYSYRILIRIYRESHLEKYRSPMFTCVMGCYGVGDHWHITCTGCRFSRLTLCDPMDCSPPGSSVHGDSQARIVEGVANFFPRGSSPTTVRTCISYIGRQILYH